MKTAMQELIDFIESQDYNFLNKEQLESCDKIQSKAKELLIEEKRQITLSFEAGATYGFDISSKNYYKNTFHNQ